MDAYIYGERLPLPEGFAAYHDRRRSAVVSIDMHQGHLADTPDCPCPAPRARELVAPIDAFHDQARRLGVLIIHVRTILRKRGDRKSTRLNSSHSGESRMPSSA